MARPEAAQAAVPASQVALPAETTNEPDTGSGRRGESRDATFPTSYARFAIDAKTQKLSIAIVDAVTDEVIREIPPEQVQRIAEDLQSLARRGSIGRRSSRAEGSEHVASGSVDRYV